MTLPSTTAILSNPQTITASGASSAFNMSTLAGGANGSTPEIVAIDVTAVSGTNPVAVFQVQVGDGTTWSTTSPPLAVGAVGTYTLRAEPTASKFRLLWNVSGTTPSFTVSAIAFP